MDKGLGHLRSLVNQLTYAEGRGAQWDNLSILRQRVFDAIREAFRLGSDTIEVKETLGEYKYLLDEYWTI